MSFELRSGCAGDWPFVMDSWLTANARTPRARDLLSAGVYFTEHKAIVRRLLETQRLTVAHAPGDADAILGWACTSDPPPDNPDPIVHYVYVRGGRAGARRCGIAQALLAEFLPHPFTYTHRPAFDWQVRIPEHAFYNPERVNR